MTYPNDLAIAQRRLWKQRFCEANSETASDLYAGRVVKMERELDTLRQEAQVYRQCVTEAADQGYPHLFAMIDANDRKDVAVAALAEALEEFMGLAGGEEDELGAPAWERAREALANASRPAPIDPPSDEVSS